jgi:hypothetical protein
MCVHAKPSWSGCALLVLAVVATAGLTMAAMPRSASAQYFSFDYSYGYPGTAYSYSPFWGPGYSFPHYPLYARPHHWHSYWGNGGGDRRWGGRSWDHGGWHNGGRSQEGHGGDRGGGRNLPNAESIARGNQFRDFLFRSFH